MAKFRPVRCVESLIPQNRTDGYIYFATDTGKIYVDTPTDRITMGGAGSAIYYAEDDAVEVIDDGIFGIDKLSMVDQEALPKVGDLIINIDGNFYKVNVEYPDYYECSRIAVSGGGGGGGGGFSDKAKLLKKDPASNHLINGRASTIEVAAISGKDPDDGTPLDTMLNLTWSLHEKLESGVVTEKYTGETITVPASTVEEPIWTKIEFGTKARFSTRNVLKIVVSGTGSKPSRTLSYEFITSELTLEKHSNFDNVNTYTPDGVNIYCTAKGNLEKIVYYYFETNGSEKLLNKGGTKVPEGSQLLTYTVPKELATHGAHKVRIELYQSVNGKADLTASATPIEMEIGVVEPGNSKPVIWLGDYKKTKEDPYYQYDSVKIPFRVFDPLATLGAEVGLFKDNNKIGNRTITDSSVFSVWEIVDGDVDMLNFYTISCGKDENETRRDIYFYMAEDPNRAGMKITETGLRYKFDASGRSNSESATNRANCVYNDGEKKVKAKFEGFNWYNNGWITDNDTRETCLRISNGAKFSIPIGDTNFATESASNQSHTFEFQFKVRNVQDYSNIIHNITRYKGNTDDRYPVFPSFVDDDIYEIFTTKTYLEDSACQEDSGFKEYDNYDAFLMWYMPIAKKAHHAEDETFPPDYDSLEYNYTMKVLNTGFASGTYYDGTHGICIGAQDAIFTNGVDTVNVAYVEDRMVNLTIVYSHGAGTAGGSDKLMSIYLNGMLTGVARSTLNDPWNIGSGSTDIVFDSKYCDFDLYKVRIYSQPLTLRQISVNYTVDLKDPVAYDLTGLAIDSNRTGEPYLSYEEMIRYNEEHPDGFIMPYLILKTVASSDATTSNVLPFSKKKKQYGSVEFVNPGLDRAFITGELAAKAEAEGKTVEEYYYHHCPSFVGDLPTPEGKPQVNQQITFQVQGTSSEFYPRRNYKMKLKGKKDKVIHAYMNRGPFAQKYLEDPASTHMDWFYMDNDTVGTTKFTLKVDYMESSGTYNMGMANLVKNAYTHHPLYDYNKAGAFVLPNDVYTEANEYAPETTYYYVSEKGKWKPTDGSEDVTITSPEDFNKKPVELAAEQGTSNKIISDTSHENYNKWYTVETTYEPYEFTNLEDYRTSVQGFPVLAFQETHDESGNPVTLPNQPSPFRFIGRYNMLLDKHSDECFGFVPLDDVCQKFLPKENGGYNKVEDMTECWEMENNSRGFCSFRDPLGDSRKNSAYPDSYFETGVLTVNKAPIIADYFEYRYSVYEDSLDIIYDLQNSVTDLEESVPTVKKELGVDISNPEPVPGDPNGLTQGMKDAGDAMLKLYSNWEKACKWIWSTNPDNVPSAGTYNKVDVGEELYVASTYYYMDAHGEYVLDESPEYDEAKAYFKKDEKGENYLPIKLTKDKVYKPATYYIPSGLGDYILDPDKEFNKGYQYYELIDNEASSGAERLPHPVQFTEGGKTYNYDTKEYRSAKFVAELPKHFNIEYLVTYFIMTELFECYDSRGKNCMMASWGPQELGGEYIWYPLFYDIDTQLGINNTGIPSFEYYVDATEDGTFSTNDSILWNNLYRNFKGQIVQKYRQIKGKDSTYDALPLAPVASVDIIEKWYLADPEACHSYAMRGNRPLIAFNLDEFFKYISITNPEIGYQDREGGISTDNGTYFYALQGNRSLSRQQFLINRINYLDSWLNQGNYERGGSNIVRGRVSANSPSNTSDKWIEGVNVNTEPTLQTNVPYWKDEDKGIKTHMFDGEYWLNMEPSRNSYVTVGTDTENFPSMKYTGKPVKFETPDLENGVRTSGGYHEQLYYIYGLDQMKSLGDISKLYWTEFNIEGRATKMTDLLLGYDGLDESGTHFKNGDEKAGINMFGIHAGNSASDNGGMPLLKKVNLSYIHFNDIAPTYDFSSSEKLEDFRAVGSNLTNVKFADGVALKTLYLPKTIKALEITEATKLNNIVTKLVERDDAKQIDVTPGLYIPGLTDATTPDRANSEINRLKLVNDCLGYDSYKLLKNYYMARKSSALSSIAITGVNWSPYVLIDEGTEYSTEDNGKHLYWRDNGHYGLVEYQPSQIDEFTTDWELLIKNGELYKKDEAQMGNASLIPTLDLLKMLKDAPNFQSTAPAQNEVPIIAGIIYVDNEEPLDELDIAATYATAYPDLKIFCKNVNKTKAAKYVILNDDGTYDVLARRVLEKEQKFFPNPREIISSLEMEKVDSRTSYDFYGWSTQKLSPKATAVLAKDNPKWYAMEEGHLSVTTDNPNSPAIATEDQYDNWHMLTIEPEVDDYTFYAVYDIHKYKMTYIDGNGEVCGVAYVPSGASVVDNTPKILPAKDDSLLATDRTYKFIGWAAQEDGDPIEWTDANVGRSSRDRTFYAVFTEASVYDNPLDDKYFYISYDGTLEPAMGAVFNGKITIPNVVNGITVTTIKGFALQPITGVFFMPENQITSFYGGSGTSDSACSTAAFAKCKNLRHVDVPEHLARIGDYAFYQAEQLETDDWRKAKSLTTIGTDAFMGAFSPRKVHKLLFPGSVEVVYAYAFGYFPSAVDVNSINFGWVDDSHTDYSAIRRIEDNAFTQNMSAKAYNMKVYVYTSSDRIDEVKGLNNGNIIKVPENFIVTDTALAK